MMDQMRRGVSMLQKSADCDTQPDHPATYCHSVRYVVPFCLENRFPPFGENALTMGRKNCNAERPAETGGWS
jgi:hypothetical protein